MHRYVTSFRRAGWLAGLILIAAFSLPAQVSTGSIAGLVTDQSRAVIAGANVT